MAQNVDSERRRKLMDLARWHDEWQTRHRVDDAEWVPEGAGAGNARPPSPEAEREFMRRADEIMGRDPDAGRDFLAEAREMLGRGPGTEERGDEGQMPLPAARTRDEAHLYLDMRPCERCGSVDAEWESALVDDDGTPVRRYRGGCGGCGELREYLFALPERPLIPGPDDIVFFGGPEPSALLDPGEWLLVADLCARAAAVPACASAQDTGSANELAEARYNLAVAVAAIVEILKFVPEGAGVVPEPAFFSPRGSAMYRQEPGRFDRRRLLIVRDTYRDMLDRMV
jgi:hypothetical protein